MQVIALSEVSRTHPVSLMAEFWAGMPRDVCPLAPLWSDFDPMSVPRALEWMILIGRENATCEGHFVRLMGEGAINLYSTNLTGMTVSEAYEKEFVVSRWKNLTEVAKTRQATFHSGNVPRKQREFIKVYRGCFPFCDDLRNITRLIVVIVPIDKNVMKYWNLQPRPITPA